MKLNSYVNKTYLVEFLIYEYNYNAIQRIFKSYKLNDL